MNTRNDILFSQQRANGELLLAERARRPDVARVHRQLAEAYQERIASTPPISRARYD